MADVVAGEIGINVKFKGLGPLQRKLAALAAAGANLSEPLSSAATIMEADVDTHFEDMKSADGTGWAPVSGWYATLKSEGKRITATGIEEGTPRDPDNILKWDNTLRQSISLGTASDGNTARVGTNLVYARIHNFGGICGGMFKGRKMPKREFMWLSPKAKAKIKNLFLAYIGEKLGK